MDGVGIGLPQKGSWKRRAPIGLGGPRGRWATLVAGRVGRSVEGVRQAGGREGIWIWGPALSADLRVVPGVLPGVGKSPLHSEASVGVLGVFLNGWVCHPLLVTILTRTKMERARHIWSQGVDQDLPDHSPKMSIEQSRTFNRFPVCSRQGGGIGSSTGGSKNDWAGGADEAAEAWKEV
jgi:hypothetical protein